MAFLIPKEISVLRGVVAAEGQFQLLVRRIKPAVLMAAVNGAAEVHGIRIVDEEDRFQILRFKIVAEFDGITAAVPVF
jgi:hypothetical protein